MWHSIRAQYPYICGIKFNQRQLQFSARMPAGHGAAKWLLNLFHNNATAQQAACLY